MPSWWLLVAGWKKQKMIYRPCTELCSCKCVNCRIIFLIIPSQCSCWITIFLNSSLWLPCAHSREILNFYYTIFFCTLTSLNSWNLMKWFMKSEATLGAMQYILLPSCALCFLCCQSSTQFSTHFEIKILLCVMRVRRRKEKFHFEVMEQLQHGR